MNYKTYAKALFESFLEKNENEFDKFFENFIKELKNKKRINLLPKILKEVKKYIELAKKKDVTEIVLRNKGELEKFQEKLSAVSKEFNLKDLKIIENKNIVGGFVLRNSKYI
jgi:F0F1-type ATP synthase delta subunit